VFVFPKELRKGIVLVLSDMKCDTLDTKSHFCKTCLSSG